MPAKLCAFRKFVYMALFKVELETGDYFLFESGDRLLGEQDG